MAEHHIQFEGVNFKAFSNSELEENFWNLLAAGKWESEYLSFMVKHLKGSGFIDVGSWIGPVTILMSHYYDKVISINFDPIVIKSFKNNLVLNSNVTLHAIGFADKAGSIRINSESLGSSMTSLYSKSGSNSVEVKMMRFDEFVSQPSLKDSIGFIKIDCVGAEYKFLGQAYRFMNNNSVMLLISYHPFVLNKPHYYFVKLYHWIRQLRYKRYYFTRQGDVIIKNPYEPIFKLTDNFPLADVLES